MNGQFTRSFIKFRNRARRLMLRVNKKQQAEGIVHYPYKNLVFKGGGIRGVAYAGVLEALEKKHILQNIERVAGTSAGAITAMLVAFRLSYSETLSLPKERTKQTRTSEFLGSLGLRNGDLVCTSRLVNEYGWYSSQYFYEWLQEITAKYCNGNSLATFADFKELGYRDLYIIVSNMSKHRAETFSYETTPDVAVVDAVRMSMSIPFFFQALRFDGQKFGAGDIYVDGGLYDNFPIQLFDDPKYAKRNPWYIQGTNWQTLGCYLYPYRSENDLEKDPKNLREFLNLTLENVFDAFQTMSYENNAIDKKRTIKISDGGISPIQFDLPTGGEAYQGLFESGRSAAEDFLSKDYPNQLFV